MKEIFLHKFKSIYYFIWDNDDKTIQLVNDYLKEVKGDSWKCIRCWDEKTQSNTSETLCISEEYGPYTSSSFFKKGEYVADFGNCFVGFSEDEYKNDVIAERWFERCP